jgi:hypothetical protein
VRFVHQRADKGILEALEAWLDFQIEAERVLGRRQWFLVNTFGKLTSGPDAGMYVSGIDCAIALGIVRALQAGRQVDVHLMHRHRSGDHELSGLRFDGGRLLMVFSNRIEVGFDPSLLSSPQN